VHCSQVGDESEDSQAWEGSELLKCRAFKQLNSRSGEVKSMRTTKAHRRQGIASKILEHIIKIFIRSSPIYELVFLPDEREIKHQHFLKWA
jgi:GNAT superfamily N-acetyltransferase